MSLGGSFVRGSVLLSGGTWAAYAINLLLQVLILRWLGPEQAGLYAFCFAINEFLRIVGAFSLQNALIQQREASQADYDTALVMCAAIGGCALVLAGLLMPVLWSARSPEAAWLLLLITTASVPRQLAQIPQAVLERDLRYGAVTVTGNVSSVLPNLGALALAGLGAGAWSLALRDVLVTVLHLGISLALAGYRFRGRVERDAWSRLMDFSRPMFVSRTLEILMERLDTLSVGALLGNRAAGFYHWGRFLAETGYVATRPLERLSLNMYSRVQDDRRRLSRAFALLNTFLIRALLAGAAVLLVFPAETVRLLLGSEWLEVAPILRWLGLYGCLAPLLHNVKMLYYGLGAVRSMVRIRWVQTGVFIVAIAAALASGWLEGVAAGLLLSTGVALGLAWGGSQRFVDVSPIQLALRPGAVFALVLVLAATGSWQAWWQPLPWWLRPFLPALAYLAGVAALEGRGLARELRFLGAQLRSSGAAES